MKVKDLMQKMLKGEALNEEENAFLTQWNEPDVERIANTRAAAARRESEAKLLETQTAFDQMREEFELFKTGKNGPQQEMENLKKENQKLLKKWEEEKVSHANTKRSNKLSQIRTRIPVIDGIAPSVVESLLGTYFGGVENLEDEEAVQTVIAKLTEENKSLIRSASTAGTGDKPRTPSMSNQSGRVWSTSEISKLTPKEYAVNREEIMTAYKNGKVK